VHIVRARAVLSAESSARAVLSAESSARALLSTEHMCTCSVEFCILPGQLYY
jgi:hypothetical protein